MKRSGSSLAVMMFLLGGCLALGGARVQAQEAKLVERGKAVYKEQKCSMCHSVADQGNKKGPLDDVGKRLTAEELRLWLIDPKVMTEKTKAARKPPMPSYSAKLPKEDVEALVAYLQTLK